jgi:hypothetical protein
MRQILSSDFPSKIVLWSRRGIGRPRVAKVRRGGACRGVSRNLTKCERSRKVRRLSSLGGVQELSRVKVSSFIFPRRVHVGARNARHSRGPGAEPLASVCFVPARFLRRNKTLLAPTPIPPHRRGCGELMRRRQSDERESGLRPQGRAAGSTTGSGTARDWGSEFRDSGLRSDLRWRQGGVGTVGVACEGRQGCSRRGSSRSRS